LSGHARFEALAGALLLNEAGEEERAEFEAHARQCALCADDGASMGAGLREFVASAAARETWQPSVARDVAARIAESRQKRVRFAVGTLGYAVAASIVLNVAFVTGVGGRAIDALRVSPEYRYAATQRLTLERRPPAVAAAPVLLQIDIRNARPGTFSVRAKSPQKKRYVTPLAPLRTPPDVVAGLALWGDSDSTRRDVAAQFDLRCGNAVETGFVTDEPCSGPTDR